MDKRDRRNQTFERLPKPRLRDLIAEVDEILRRFESISNRFMPETVCGKPDNTPVRFPLSLSWRREVGDAAPSELAADVVAWLESFKRYLASLGSHFIDWQERPAVLKRFPLHRYPFDQQEQRISHDQLIANLQEHKRLLLIEAEKCKEIIPQTLAALLRGARANHGLTQASAAGELGISLATYKSWEQGKVFPSESKHMKIKRFVEAVHDPTKA
jgi:DNA-binding XRE family transcriptional regulator